MKQRHILVVEDDPSIREAYAEVLEGAGFIVDTCENGEQALVALDTIEAPCLILLDMRMPVMDGQAFMAAFTKRPRAKSKIPVYLVSATAAPAEGKQMGCTGYLKKPFALDDLLALVQSHFPKRPHPNRPNFKAPLRPQ